MAREFATSEIIRQKCSICGSKNKLYTEIVYKGIHYGYKLTCCNCGHVDTFMDDPVGPAGLINNQFTARKEICIQLTTCKNTDCRYYGKFSVWDSKTSLDAILNGSGSQNSGSNNGNCVSGSGCVCGCNDGSHSCPGSLGNLNTVQLDINGCNENNGNPRFH